MDSRPITNLTTYSHYSLKGEKQMKHFYRWEDFPQREITYLQGLPEASKLLVRIFSTERMMVTKIDAKKGAGVGRHFHEAEQILFVLKGKMKVHVGNEPPRIIGPGEITICPANCPHGGEWLQDGEALEVVSPIRLDNFVGYTIPHTFFEEKK
jgi:quercetin dioxygenase-like cupin family protein